MFEIHVDIWWANAQVWQIEDIWWANTQLWNDWGYLMSQYSYSSLKRLTIFVGTCLESLNLGGEGRDQTISKDCSPQLSFVLLKGDRRCKIKEQSQDNEIILDCVSWSLSFFFRVFKQKQWDSWWLCRSPIPALGFAAVILWGTVFGYYPMSAWVSVFSANIPPR